MTTTTTFVTGIGKSTSIMLDQPIQRGKTAIDSVSIRKPSAGELRGVSMSKLIEMDVNSVMAVLPRVSEPALTAPEIAGMDPADLFAVSIHLASFFVRRADLIVVTV